MNTKAALTAAITILFLAILGTKAGIIAGAVMAFYFISVEIDHAIQRTIRRFRLRLRKRIRKITGAPIPTRTNKPAGRKPVRHSRVIRTCADCAGGSHIWCHGKCDCTNPYHAEEALKAEAAAQAKRDRQAVTDDGKIPF